MVDEVLGQPLYKTQVYALAEYLGIPEEIRSRPPTTDTYSMPQSQEEFYFSLPYARKDMCLFGRNNGVLVQDIAVATASSATSTRSGRRRSTTCTSGRNWLTTSLR